MRHPTITAGLRQVLRLLALAWALVLSGGIGLLFCDLLGGNAWIGAYTSWLPPLTSLLAIRSGTTLPRGHRILRDPLLAGVFGASVAVTIDGSLGKAVLLAGAALLAALALDRVSLPALSGADVVRGRGAPGTPWGG